MKNVSTLNHTIGSTIRQALSIDTRNIATFILAVNLLLTSQSVNLSAWASSASDLAKAGSRVRRYSRWLASSSINPHEWYDPIFRHAMREWTKMPIFLAFDTSMLYDRFCCVRISMIYMNRAIPVTWRVLEHDSSSVKYEKYADLFDRVVSLLPKDVEIIFMADRGFVCRELMRRLQQLKWTWRIRVKGNQKLRTQNGFITLKTLPLSIGKALLYSQNMNFGKGLERISLSACWVRGSQEPWYVLSGDAASTEIFVEYSRRFGIEEGFRDEKSGGCDLEEGRIHDAKKLERLLLVIATALLIAVSEGISMTLAGKREEIDPHHLRSLSYFQLGVRWIQNCMMHDLKRLFYHCLLRPMNEPIPVASTKKESIKRRKMKMPAHLFKDVKYVVL